MNKTMKAPMISALIAAAVAGVWGTQIVAQSGAKETSHAHGSIATYLIEFAEPGLLRSVSRAEGQRFDAKSPDAVAYRDQLMAIQTGHKSAIAGRIGRYPDVTHHYLATHSGIAARLTAEEAAMVAGLPGVTAVEQERLETIDTYAGPTFIGANTIWNGTSVPGGIGTRGQGMVVAVLDSSIVSLTHPSFVNDASCGHGAPNPDKVLSRLDCSTTDGTGLCNGPTPADTNGHGSHTASTAGGNVVPTSASPAPAQPISGVAPCANLRIYKVCPGQSCPGAAIQGGMNSILLHGDVDVMNFSISGGRNPYTDNDRRKLDLVDAGVFVAASAGNTSSTVPNPIGAVNHIGPWVLSVAASFHHATPDTLAGFSLRGPTPAPFVDLTKPDITGPGVSVYAANISAGGYGNSSGTSMSSPHLAGAATLLRKVHPTWTPIQVKSAIMMTAKRTGTGAAGTWTPDEIGNGRIDLAAAVNAGLLMDESTANFLAANPAGGSIDARDLNLPAVRDLTCEPTCTWTRTVRNALGTPATWDVGFDDPTGFTLSATPSSFVIPAGGSQAITITATVEPGEPGTAVRFGAVTLSKLPLGPQPVHHITVAVQGSGGVDLIFADDFEAPPSAIVVVDNINRNVPQNVDGVSINFNTGAIIDGDIPGSHFNPYATSNATLLSFFWGHLPGNGGVAASTTAGDLLVLQSGATIGPASIYVTAFGASPAWRAGVNGYVGFRFDCLPPIAPVATVCYGYVRMQSTGPNGFPATILSYAFDRTGAPITIP
jgi:subtilisin family serine protease